jgi:hypothetical protein
MRRPPCTLGPLPLELWFLDKTPVLASSRDAKQEKGRASKPARSPQSALRTGPRASGGAAMACQRGGSERLPLAGMVAAGLLLPACEAAAGLHMLLPAPLIFTQCTLLASGSELAREGW